MTAPEILYSVILALISGILSLIVCNRKRDAAALFAFIQISWWVRWAFNYLNFQLDFFAQKDASEMSLSMIDQPGGIWAIFDSGLLQGFSQMKFFIEAMVNLPALRLFEESVYILNITNGFVGAICGLLVFGYFRRLFDIRIATIGLVLTSIYPAAIAFSFFALRDVFIYFFVLMNVCSFAWVYLRNPRSTLNWFLYIVSLISIVACRTELIVFVIVIPGWTMLIWILDLLGRIRNRAGRMLTVAALCLAIPLISVGTAYVGYTIIIKKLGFSSFVSPLELASEYDTARSTRGTSGAQTTNVLDGSGQGSNVLPPALYARAPILVRVTIQIIGMMVIPMPWLLTGASRWFAFTDSVFAITVMIWHLRSQRLFSMQKRRGIFWIPPSVLRYNRRKLFHFILANTLTFALGCIGFGFIISNGGNAFRMRLCLVPYLIMGASIYVSVTYAWVGGRFITMKRFAAMRLPRARSRPNLRPEAIAPSLPAS